MQTMPVALINRQQCGYWNTVGVSGRNVRRRNRNCIAWVHQCRDLCNPQLQQYTDLRNPKLQQYTDLCNPKLQQYTVLFTVIFGAVKDLKSAHQFCQRFGCSGIQHRAAGLEFAEVSDLTLSQILGFPRTVYSYELTQRHSVTIQQTTVPVPSCFHKSHFDMPKYTDPITALGPCPAFKFRCGSQPIYFSWGFPISPAKFRATVSNYAIIFPFHISIRSYCLHALHCASIGSLF